MCRRDTCMSVDRFGVRDTFSILLKEAFSSVGSRYPSANISWSVWVWMMWEVIMQCSYQSHLASSSTAPCGGSELLSWKVKWASISDNSVFFLSSMDWWSCSKAWVMISVAFPLEL